MPNLYIIAGCNGAGKTTTSYTVLPEMLNCRGLKNFFALYKDISDSWVIYDNSQAEPSLVAKGKAPLVSHIFNDYIWKKIQSDK